MSTKALQVRIGDTLSIPQNIHRIDNKKGNAIGEVIGIYPHLITIKQNNGIKFSIYKTDLENYREKGIKVVSHTTERVVDELSDDILNNI